jgi:hypothetical protein
MTADIQLGHNDPQQPDSAVADKTAAAEEVLFEVGDASAPPPTLEEPVTQPEVAVQKEPVVSSNAILQDPIDLPSKKPLLPSDFRVSLPSFPLGVFTGLLHRAASADTAALESPTRAEWQKVTTEINDMYTPGNMYSDRFQDPTSQFRQGLLTPDGHLHNTK